MHIRFEKDYLHVMPELWFLWFHLCRKQTVDEISQTLYVMHESCIRFALRIECSLVSWLWLVSISSYMQETTDNLTDVSIWSQGQEM